MHSIFRTLIAVALLVGPSMAIAEEPATPPASQPSADAGTLIQASDKDALAANKDKDVVVEGVIDKAEWSSTGKVMKATFKDAGESKLQTILFVKNREKFDQAFSGDVSKALSGAKVRVKGKLQEYRNAPEIVLNEVNQITVVEAAPATQPAQ